MPHEMPHWSYTFGLIALVVMYWFLSNHTLWQLVAFVSGMFTVWVAVASPLGNLDHQLLTAHMVQHLLLMTVAAPLILLAAPFGGLVVSRPVFCWLASTATVIGWHVPVLFDLGMRSSGWHTFEQMSFLVAGLLFWSVVIQPRVDGWHVPVYLFLATLPCDVLAGFLTFCNRVIYPGYLSSHRMVELSALEDQQFAGALMWFAVTFAYLVPAAVVSMRLLEPFTSNSTLTRGAVGGTRRS